MKYLKGLCVNYKIYINIDEAIKDWDDELLEDLERKEYEKYSNVQDYIEDYKITEYNRKKRENE
jgi:protein-arginine kinase activator protein McsA